MTRFKKSMLTIGAGLFLVMGYNNCSSGLGGASGGNEILGASSGPWVITDKKDMIPTSVFIRDIKGTSDQNLWFSNSNLNSGGGVLYHLTGAGLLTKGTLSRTMASDGLTIVNAPDSGYQFGGLSGTEASTIFTQINGQYPMLAKLENGAFTKIGGGASNNQLPITGQMVTIQSGAPLTKAYFNTMLGICTFNCFSSSPSSPSVYVYYYYFYSFDGATVSQVPGAVNNVYAFHAVNDNLIYYASAQSIHMLKDGVSTTLYTPAVVRDFKFTDLYYENENSIHATYGNQVISFNGTQWTTEVTPKAEAVYRIRSYQGLTVAVGSSGMLLTKENGQWKVLREPYLIDGNYNQILILNKNLFYTVGRSLFERVSR